MKSFPKKILDEKGEIEYIEDKKETVASKICKNTSNKNEKN